MVGKTESPSPWQKKPWWINLNNHLRQSTGLIRDNSPTYTIEPVAIEGEDAKRVTLDGVHDSVWYIATNLDEPLKRTCLIRLGDWILGQSRIEGQVTLSAIYIYRHSE